MGTNLTKQREKIEDEIWNKFLTHLGPNEQRHIIRKLNYYHNREYMVKDLNTICTYLNSNNPTRNLLIRRRNYFLSIKAFLENENINYVYIEPNQDLPFHKYVDFIDNDYLLFVDNYNQFDLSTRETINKLLHRNLLLRRKILVTVHSHEVNDDDIGVLNYFDQFAVL